jgi:hypothetical protein
MEGILAWAIEGALDYLENGLGIADAIKTATDTYRHDSDALGDFLEDHNFAIAAGLSIPKKELKSTYDTWCQDNGIIPLGQKVFKALLTERGVIDGKTGSIRTWRGIGVNETTGTTGTRETGFTNKVLTRGLDKPEFTENASQMSLQAQVEGQDVPNSLPDCPDCGQEIGELPSKNIQIPTMITIKMETALKKLGYSATDIDSMTPEQAWKILNANEEIGELPE